MAVAQVLGRQTSVRSSSTLPFQAADSWGIKWGTDDFINAHKEVKNSGSFNFEGCKIPIPTAIRYDRIREALGEDITPKEERTLQLLKFGMPINCKRGFGIRKKQKNHVSALSFKQDVGNYLSKGIQTNQILGPFKEPPINDFCFSPLMTVPKESTKRRVIVDFSFPPGKSINEGIPKDTYLDFDIEFSLPSVSSMVDRINVLGIGCLLFKRDLKGAFRQFSSDPGDYNLTGLSWEDAIFLDTRLAMEFGILLPVCDRNHSKDCRKEGKCFRLPG